MKCMLINLHLRPKQRDVYFSYKHYSCSMKQIAFGVECANTQLTGSAVPFKIKHALNVMQLETK